MLDRKAEGMTITKIVERIKRKYKLEIDENEQNSLIKKLKSISKMIPAKTTDQNGESIMTNLFEASVCLQGERPDHYFTEHEVTLLINHPELNKYIKKNLLLDETKKAEYEEFEKKAKSWNQKYFKYREEDLEYTIKMRELYEQGYPYGEDPNFVPYERARRKALEIMLEALFLRYFEPIDIENLRKDMEIRSSMDDAEGEYTVEMAVVYSRLENPMESYCKPRKPDSEN